MYNSSLYNKTSSNVFINAIPRRSLSLSTALESYRAPRLTKLWSHLERQSGAGGVGLRGPGESQLEIDKRLLRDRIHSLRKQIDSISRHRSLQRKSREQLGTPLVSLIGYTNAGKSSLLNKLTTAKVLAEDILFATLDPTTRSVKLPGLKTHPEVILTDTVGFIQKVRGEAEREGRGPWLMVERERALTSFVFPSPTPLRRSCPRP